LDKRLRQLANKIKHKTLRRKTLEFLENPTVTIDGKVYYGLPLDVAPAGLSRHHSYPGGFMEHVLAMAQIALGLCEVVEGVYGGKVNRDFVLAGVVLHDVFKPLTYEVRENGSYAVAPLGDRVDHLTLATSELVQRGFPLDVVHIVVAHHGGEAGPIYPRTVEALVCHLADSADSQLNGEILRAARYLSQRAMGVDLPLLTSSEAFEIVNAKVWKGWEGVKKTVEKIEQRRLRVR